MLVRIFLHENHCVLKASMLMFSCDHVMLCTQLPRVMSVKTPNNEETLGKFANAWICLFSQLG